MEASNSRFTSVRWAAVVAIVMATTIACSASDGSSAFAPPDDPLGVVDDLRDDSNRDLVKWVMCSEVSSTVGIFSPTKQLGFVQSLTRQPTSAEPSGFQIRHRQTVGRGDLVERRDRYERTLSNDVFYDWRVPSGYPDEPSPFPVSLQTMEGVRQQLDLLPDDGELVETENPFVRFESLPIPPVLASAGQTAGVDQLGLPNRRVVWVLDVWANDAGDVRRLRAMTSTGGWRELIFVESATWPRPDLDACPEQADVSTNGWLGRDGWQPTLVVPLDVTLDPTGHPYDVAIDDTVQLRSERIGHFVVPEGKLRVADGISIGVSINETWAEEFQHVDFPVTDTEHNVTELDVIMLFEVRSYTAPLGVRAEIPGRSVQRWGDWEFAYGTDGGLGGLVTQSLIDVAREQEWDMDTQPVTFDDDPAVSDYFFADMDGVTGDDYLTFSNGFGDGGFPMAKGYDEAGDIVALIVWDNRYPWRLAVPDGTPPATVTAREAEFRRCIDDPTLVELDGSCPTTQ